MNLEDLFYLQSSEGREWASRLSRSDEDVHTTLRRLRKRLTSDQARALMELNAARRAMSGKHALADELFLDRPAAEQSSSEEVARWRAERYRDVPVVLDLCCGAGGDAFALAAHTPVVAVDADPVRLEFARLNAEVTGRDLQLVRGRVPQCVGAPHHVFCDPDRRRAGKRLTDPEEGSPSLRQLLDLGAQTSLGVKLSPMADLTRLVGLGELEFISSRGELKEIVLWTGELARAETTVSLPACSFSISGETGHTPDRAAAPGGILLDPDPALIRSGLLGELAKSLQLRGLAPKIAYLTSDQPVRHPLLKEQAIIGWVKARQRSIQELLDREDIGRLDISRRGYPESPEEVRKRLRLKGSRPGHLHLTRCGDDRVAILTRALNA